MIIADFERVETPERSRFQEIIRLDNRIALMEAKLSSMKNQLKSDIGFFKKLQIMKQIRETESKLNDLRQREDSLWNGVSK